MNELEQKKSETADEFDYFFIFSAGTADVPLLECDSVNSRALRFLAFNKPVEIGNPIYLCFNQSIEIKNPRMVDYHCLPSTVFSQKIVDVLNPLNINDLQFVPAIINGNNETKYENYWIVNACNPTECFDTEKSVFKIGGFTKKWTDIEKVVLDKNKLSKIPLEQRLVVKPQETVQFNEIYHKSVVDKIMAVNPEGVAFIPVEQWYEGIQFEQ